MFRGKLIDQLLKQPHRFNFFQAVRLIEQMCDSASTRRIGPVGLDNVPSREILRFRAQPSLSFAANTITAIKQKPKEEEGLSAAQMEMVVSFFGLTGPAGVLPQHYTRLLIGQVRQKDFTLRDFFDLFNHRFVSLFYRAWEKYRLPIQYERAQRQGGEQTDKITQALLSLVGFGTGALRNRLHLPREVFLFFAGHFARFPRNAESLQCLLCEYFQLPIRVEQFSGQWFYLSAENCSRLGGSPHEETNNQLGLNCIAGERIWDVQSKFRLRIGPLTFQQFDDLLPGRLGFQRICQMIRSYVGLDFDFDLQAVLLESEVPGSQLNSLADAESPLLGWNSWLRSDSYECELESAIFSDHDSVVL